MEETKQEIQNYRKEKASLSSKTLKEIQSMFAYHKGWDSEESMIYGMAAFRQKHTRLFKENR